MIEFISKNRIFVWLINIHWFIFILLITLTIILVNKLIFLIPVFNNISTPKEIKNIFEFGVIWACIILVVIIPLIETLIFQTSIITAVMYFQSRLGYKNLTFPLIISSLIFGFAHAYSAEYVLAATIIGSLFAFFYLISIQRKESQFIIIFSAHALVNLIAFLDYI